MTVQRSKQFLVQGYMNHLKKKNEDSASRDGYCQRAAFISYTWVAAARSARWIKSTV